MERKKIIVGNGQSVTVQVHKYKGQLYCRLIVVDEGECNFVYPCSKKCRRIAKALNAAADEVDKENNDE